MRLVVLVFLLTLSACMPQEQAFIAAPPGEPRITEKTFHTADGLDLPSRRWLPKGKPKAIIAALHGFNDYSNAFSTVGPFFASRGIALYAYDQRGFGASPHTGIWGGRDNYAHDLKRYIEALRAQYSGVPVYALGESMGGAVVISAVTRGEFPKLDGIILAAPALWGQQTMNPFFRFSLWAIAHTIPDSTFTGSDLKIQATDNLKLLKRMGEDPLVLKQTRVDAVYGIVRLMDTAYGSIPSVNLPTLVLYGGNDEVIPLTSLESALERFRIPVTFGFYPSGYHMLMRDLKGEVVMRDIASWVKSPDAPLPSGFGARRDPLDAIQYIEK